MSSNIEPIGLSRLYLQGPAITGQVSINMDGIYEISKQDGSREIRRMTAGETIDIGETIMLNQLADATVIDISDPSPSDPSPSNHFPVWL